MTIALVIIGGLLSLCLFAILNPIKAIMGTLTIAAFLLAFYGWIGVISGGPRPHSEFLTFALGGSIGWIVLLRANKQVTE